MRTVHKYLVPVRDGFGLDLPLGATILDVQAQGELVCLWALVETDNDMERRSFILRGTGHPIQDGMELVHAGTFQIGGGALVFHLFEVMPPETPDFEFID